MQSQHSIIEDIATDGYAFIRQFLSRKQIAELKMNAEALHKTRIIEESFVGSMDNALIYSPMFDNKCFMDVLLDPRLTTIFSELMDKDFALMHYVLGNRCKGVNSTAKYVRDKVAADKWHVDSRYNNGKRLGDGFSFIAIVAISSMNHLNCTQVVSGSHLDRRPPNPDGDYLPTRLTMEPGDLVILDSGLWHKGGTPINEARWGLHMFFAPWFVKPYYSYVDRPLPDFWNQYSEKQANLGKKLLHHNSWPPSDHRDRIQTVIPLQA